MMILYGLTKKARQQISNTGLLWAFFVVSLTYSSI